MAGSSRTISTISAKLTTEVAGWSSGIKKATNQVDVFYSHVGKKAKSLASPLTSVLGQVKGFGDNIGGLAKSIASPLAGVGKAMGALGPVATAAGVAGLAVGGAFLGVAGAAGAAGVAIGAMASAGMDRIDQLTDTAQRLGVTTEALSELRYAANLTGSSAEDLDLALQKFGQGLGDAEAGATPFTAALGKIGLSYREIASDSPDVAFNKVVKAFEAVPSAATKASVAVDLFGKGGVKLLNTLSAGSDEINRLREEAVKLGVSVSQVDAAKIGTAKDSLDRVGAAFEGVGNKLAIGLAPYIETAATLFVDWFADVWDGGKIIDTVIDSTVHGLASVIDYLEPFGKTFMSVFEGIASAVGWVVKGIGTLTGSLSTIDLDDKTKPSTKFLEAYDQWRKKSNEAAAATGETVKKNLEAGRSNDAFGNTIKGATDKLKDQLATTGMSSAEIEVYKLKQAGATAAELADVDALTKQIKAKEEAVKKTEEMKDFGKSLAEKVRSPLEKYQEEVRKIDEALSKGIIGADLARRGKESAAKEGGLHEAPKFAGALDVRSTEGYSAILSATTGRPEGFRNLETIAKQQLNATLAQTKVIADVKKARQEEPLGMGA